MNGGKEEIETSYNRLSDQFSTLLKSSDDLVIFLDSLDQVLFVTCFDGAISGQGFT